VTSNDVGRSLEEKIFGSVGFETKMCSAQITPMETPIKLRKPVYQIQEFDILATFFLHLNVHDIDITITHAMGCLSMLKRFFKNSEDNTKSEFLIAIEPFLFNMLSLVQVGLVIERGKFSFRRDYILESNTFRGLAKALGALDMKSPTRSGGWDSNVADAIDFFSSKCLFVLFSLVVVILYSPQLSPHERL
jgi:hypothetical protein